MMAKLGLQGGHVHAVHEDELRGPDQRQQRVPSAHARAAVRHACALRGLRGVQERIHGMCPLLIARLTLMVWFQGIGECI